MGEREKLEGIIQWFALPSPRFLLCPSLFVVFLGIDSLSTEAYCVDYARLWFLLDIYRDLGEKFVAFRFLIREARNALASISPRFGL